jgi:glucose-6-phosphate 1-dehydrogenase
MLAMLIMERPVSMHPDDIRDEKTKAIRSMRVLKPEDVVIGQYTAANGKPGYLDDEGVPKDSRAPTYAVCRIMCDNARWAGVPMLIKAGKALNETKMEVRVQFETQAGGFFKDEAQADGMRNEFVMQLKPKEASAPLLLARVGLLVVTGPFGQSGARIFFTGINESREA